MSYVVPTFSSVAAQRERERERERERDRDRDRETETETETERQRGQHFESLKCTKSSGNGLIPTIENCKVGRPVRVPVSGTGAHVRHPG